MTDSWNSQIENRNFLSPLGFKMVMPKFPKVVYFSQTAAIPAITITQPMQSTRYGRQLPLEGTFQYEDFEMSFIVDEDMENYLLLHNWLRALGTPDNYGERTSWMMEHGDSNNLKNNRMAKTSDGTLQVLNNNNIANFDVVFEDMFPVSLSTLDFNVTNTDTDYLTASVTFKYLLYEIRNTNQRTRR